MPVARTAADGVGPAAGEVYALSLKGTKILRWVDFHERKDTFHPNMNTNLSSKHPKAAGRFWRRVAAPELSIKTPEVKKKMSIIPHKTFNVLLCSSGERCVFFLLFFNGWKEEILLVASWKENSIPASPSGAGRRTAAPANDLCRPTGCSFHSLLLLWVSAWLIRRRLRPISSSVLDSQRPSSKSLKSRPVGSASLL